MKKDISIPQGKFKIGRDINEGIYLIAALNDLSFVTIDGPNNKHEHYTLDEEDNTMIVHIEVEKGDTLTIDGKVKLRHITRFIEGDNCNLFEGIANFEKGIKTIGKTEKNISYTVMSEDSTSYKSKNAGLFGTLLSLLSFSLPSENSWLSDAKKHSGRCDGDCSSCPSHYGYRYGRWYYGHGHNHGCEFGGNKGGGSQD